MGNPILLGQGEPLIIIHGLFGSSRNWQTLGKRYAEYFTVVLVDVRNHGKSFHDNNMDYTLMAQDIIKLMEYLGFPCCHLLGHSMGGKIAMTLAHMQPQLVNKLIVADIAPIRYLHDYHGLIDAIMALDLSPFKRRADVDQALAEDIADIGIRQFILQSLVMHNAQLAWRINWASLKNNMQAIIGFERISHWHIENASLFIHGALSNYLSLEARKLVQKHFNQVEIFAIPGAGHWLHAEQPDLFFKKTSHFLQQAK